MSFTGRNPFASAVSRSRDDFVRLEVLSKLCFKLYFQERKFDFVKSDEQTTNAIEVDEGFSLASLFFAPAIFIAFLFFVRRRR